MQASRCLRNFPTAALMLSVFVHVLRSIEASGGCPAPLHRTATIGVPTRGHVGDVGRG